MDACPLSVCRHIATNLIKCNWTVKIFARDLALVLLDSNVERCGGVLHARARAYAPHLSMGQIGLIRFLVARVCLRCAYATTGLLTRQGVLYSSLHCTYAKRFI